MEFLLRDGGTETVADTEGSSLSSTPHGGQTSPCGVEFREPKISLVLEDEMDEKRVTGELKKVAGQVEAAAGDLTGDRETEAEGRATELQGTVENLVGQAKDTASDLAGQAGELARDALRTGRERLPSADEAYRRGNAAVRSHVETMPLASLVVALGAGYLLGLLIHRRE
ncbi:hypothetical protein MGN01_43560 [Methylobacterium gnaphalii]|uniref:CsbD-like domain-containing protein n=2 Tax=Methylobacterium gnaphalii TaxID=1010610 RepID=A0A512JRD8_9HYPH|nr:hypothetical protein MGN01_43560 [Methylobacterium gnaphalii]GLS51472.1 hypothetical protein GCM10007885_43290 [Methylobacterium gnaphalii]